MPFRILIPQAPHTSFAPATDPTPDPAPTKPKGAGPSPRCPSSCGTGPLPRAVPPSGQNAIAGERRPAYQATVIPAHRVLRRSGSVRSSWSSGAPSPPLCSHHVHGLFLIQYPPTPPASSSPPRRRLHSPRSSQTVFTDCSSLFPVPVTLSDSLPSGRSGRCGQIRLR